MYSIYVISLKNVIFDVLIKIRMRYLLVLVVVCLVSCQSQERRSNVESISALYDSNKPIAELSYEELSIMLLEANGAIGANLNGISFGKNGLEHLTVMHHGKCANKKCGSGLKLRNTARDSVQAVIKFSFKLPDNPINEMSRIYSVASNEIINLGCSVFCYAGQEYGINVTIESAELK